MTAESDVLIHLPLLRDLTYREWHAFINGLYKGFVEGGRHHQYEAEKHYWRVGYIGGFLLRVGLLYLVITRVST